MLEVTRNWPVSSDASSGEGLNQLSSGKQSDVKLS